LAEYKKEIGAAVSVAMAVAAVAGAFAVYYFPNSLVTSSSTGHAGPSAAEFESSLGRSVSTFQTQLMQASDGRSLDSRQIALLAEDLGKMQQNYTVLNLQYELNFRGITTTFEVLNSSLVFVSSKSQVATNTIELNVTDGSQVCPEDFSGFGSAAWDGNSSTCTLTQTNPNVGPTLCLGADSGGCITQAALRYKVDSGVTLDLIPGGCVYSVLDNHGVINFGSPGKNLGGGLCNFGIVDNYGTLNLNGPSVNVNANGGGVINNFAGAILRNDGDFSNGGAINNFGTFINDNRFDDCVGGAPIDFGTLNYNSFQNLGTYHACGTPPSGILTVALVPSPSTLTPGVYVNGTLHQMPYTFKTGGGDITNITAAEMFGTSLSYQFVSWSNGGNRTQQYMAEANATLTATYSA